MQKNGLKLNANYVFIGILINLLLIYLQKLIKKSMKLRKSSNFALIQTIFT